MPQLMEVLEHLDQSAQEMVTRVPASGPCEIKWGAQLTVRESQSALFFRDGRTQMQFEAGRHILKTQNIPILTKLVTQFGYGPDSPFRAEVYFVSTKLFAGLKWGTPQPIAFRDTDLHMVRLRAFGMYSLRITDPALFLNRMVGTLGKYNTRDIQDHLRSLINNRLIDLFGDVVKSVFDLPRYYSELGVAMKARMADDLAAAGLEMTDFAVEAITPPEEVQKMIDQRSSMAALGDMNTYMQFKSAQALEKAAANPSGGMGASMGMGAGLGMGMMMPNMMQNAFMQQQPAQAAAPAAPPPPAPAAAAAASPAAAAAEEEEDPFETIKKLKQLLDLGAIDEAEFNAKKTELLKRM